jgi:hypothetical protein
MTQNIHYRISWQSIGIRTTLGTINSNTACHYRENSEEEKWMHSINSTLTKEGTHGSQVYLLFSIHLFYLPQKEVSYPSTDQCLTQ